MVNFGTATTLELIKGVYVKWVKRVGGDGQMMQIKEGRWG